MTIVAQDPSVGGERGMLRATVGVPADRLEPGPRSHRFQVIDYDATARILLPPARLTAGGWQAGDWGWVEPDPFRQRTSLSATMDLQPGITHVELAAPAFGDAPFTVVSSG